MSTAQNILPSFVPAELYRFLLPACLVLLLLPAVIALWLLLPAPAPCTSPVTGQQALPWLNDERAREMAGCGT